MSTKHFETDAIRTQISRTEYLDHSAPMCIASRFVFDDAEEMRTAFTGENPRNIYSRSTNPNTTEFVEKVCKMEGAEAGYAFATGMAAVFSSLAALLDS